MSNNVLLQVGLKFKVHNLKVNNKAFQIIKITAKSS